MITSERYKPEHKLEWDSFIRESRADTLLYFRDFIDYHSDRFTDCSFVFYRNGKLEAVMPGNIDGDKFISHQGLTYGGLVSSQKMTAVETLEAFNSLINELISLGVRQIIYKPSPYIYHKLPSQEDIYALYRLGAVKIGCDISTTIFQNSKIPFSELRKRGIKKALKESVVVEESNDLENFWALLTENLLQKYNKKPVHSLKEIINLKSLFPDNIKLYVSIINGEIISGCLVFEMQNVVHVQYISANDKGKITGALDLLFNYLINCKYEKITYFDFGKSTEQSGKYLNENLIFQKEGFGGRGVVYETYKLELK